jgi:hypothetical protein
MASTGKQQSELTYYPTKRNYAVHETLMCVCSLFLLIASLNAGVAAPADSPNDVYRRTVWSVPWITTETRASLIGFGSGVVVMRYDNRALLVATCAHVVEPANELSRDQRNALHVMLVVYFPFPDHNGQPVTEIPSFHPDQLERSKIRSAPAILMGAFIGHWGPAAIAAIDSKKDLAILEVWMPLGLPDRIKPVKVSPKVPRRGQRLQIIGCPADRPLWRSTLGEATGTFPLPRFEGRYHNDKYTRNYDCLRFPSGTWGGNSGGPVLDERGEIVGILSAGSPSDGGESVAVDGLDAAELTLTCKKYGAITIANPTRYRIVYEFRRNPQSKWESCSLDAGYQRLHAHLEMSNPQMRLNNKFGDSSSVVVYDLKFFPYFRGKNGWPLSPSDDGKPYEFSVSYPNIVLVDKKP